MYLENKIAPLEMIPPHYVKRNMYKSRHSILYQKEIFDRYQNVRHLTGSMGFWFIFQTFSKSENLTVNTYLENNFPSRAVRIT